MLFTVFGLFAFSFYVGTVLVVNEYSNSVRIVSQNQRFEIVRYDEHKFNDKLNHDETKLLKNIDLSKYTGGDVFGCFLGVLFGIFSISFTLPNFKAI